MRVLLKILIIVVVIAAILWLANRWSGNRLGNLVTWGKPITEEHFNDGSWRDRWAVYEGGFDVRDGRLVSTGDASSTLVLREKISGPIAIEFTGTYQPGSSPCDLSLIWYDEVEFGPRGNVTKARPVYQLQIGAFDNTFSCIQDGSGRKLAYSDFRVKPGQSLLLRFEIRNSELAVLVNGRLLLQCTLPIAVPAGWPAVYGHYAGKAFDDIRVFRQQIGNQVPATAVGDWLAQHQRFGEAADEYQHVASALGRGALADRARWLRAVCLDQIEDPRSLAAWEALKGTRYANRAEAAALERAFKKGDYPVVIERFPSVYASLEPDAKPLLEESWTRWVQHLRRSRSEISLLNQFADLQREHLADANMTHRAACELLIHLKRHREVINRFPLQTGLVADSWVALGYAEKALALQADAGWGRTSILMHLGRYEEILKDGPTWGVGHALSHLGRIDDLRTLMPTQRVYQALCLQRLGRFEEIVENYADIVPIVIDSLIQLGRIEEARALIGDDEERRWQFAQRTGDTVGMKGLCSWDLGRVQTLRWAEALTAWGEGTTDELREKRKPLYEGIWTDDDACFTQLILFPAAEALSLDQSDALVDAAQRTLGDREQPWRSRLDTWLGIITSGNIPESSDGRVPSLYQFCQTLHLDFAKDPAEAAAGWARLLENPRIAGMPRIFALARLKQLQKDG